MHLSALLMAGYDPTYLRITEHLVRRELASGNDPLVIDATVISGAASDSYNRGLLGLFGPRYPGFDFRERMSRLGVTVVDVLRYVDMTQSGDLGFEREEELAIAVQSALITYFRTDQPDRTRPRVARTAEALTCEGRVVYRGMSAIFAAHPRIGLLYLPNGRFPHQKMARIAATDSDLTVLHFEKGETPHGAYLQRYAPQDRFASQGSVQPILAGLGREEVGRIADEWLSSRAPSQESRNEFSALWGQHLPPELARLAEDGKPLASFFTSSQDEFQFLGAEWHVQEWTHQFEAFDAALTKLASRGYRCYLRVRPNLATKAHDTFVRENASIRWLAGRHPDLVIIPHDDFANTYSLLDVTDAVVVWYSTIGLEASARGLPVWCMAARRYGLVADTREVLSPAALAADAMEPWRVDSHAAKRFIAYIVLRDDQMDPDHESWLPWDASHPPLGARLAAALVAGGVPHKRDSVKSVLDVYRHRRLRSNLRHIRSRRAPGSTQPERGIEHRVLRRVDPRTSTTIDSRRCASVRHRHGPTELVPSPPAGGWSKP
jgi:hypothetical protein